MIILKINKIPPRKPIDKGNLKNKLKRAAAAALLATALGTGACSSRDVSDEKAITNYRLDKLSKKNNEWYYDKTDNKDDLLLYSIGVKYKYKINPDSLIALTNNIKPTPRDAKEKISKINNKYLKQFSKKNIIAVWNGNEIININLDILKERPIKDIQKYVTKEDSLRIESIFFDLAKDQFPANKYIYSQSNVQNATVPKIDSTYNVFEKRGNYLNKFSNYTLGSLINDLTPEHYKIIHNAFIKMPADVQSYIITATKNASIDLEYRELKKYAKNKEIIQWSIIAPLAVFGLLLGGALKKY